MTDNAKMGIKDFWNNSSTDMKVMQIVFLAICAISIIGFIIAAVALAKANNQEKKQANNNQPQYNNNYAYPSQQTPHGINFNYY